MLFGEKIKLLRKGKGLTQSELAKTVGVTLRTVQNYETKNLFPKNQNVVTALCSALDTTPDYLISDNDIFINKAYEKGGTKEKQYAEKLVSEVTAMFAGGELSEEDRDDVMQAIQEAYWKAKKINNKYTPKKYRKNE